MWSCAAGRPKPGPGPAWCPCRPGRSPVWTCRRRLPRRSCSGLRLRRQRLRQLGCRYRRTARPGADRCHLRHLRLPQHLARHRRPPPAGPGPCVARRRCPTVWAWPCCGPRAWIRPTRTPRRGWRNGRWKRCGAMGGPSARSGRSCARCGSGRNERGRARGRAGLAPACHARRRPGCGGGDRTSCLPVPVDPGHLPRLRAGRAPGPAGAGG